MAGTKPRAHRHLRTAGFGLLAGAVVSRRMRKGMGLLGFMALIGAWLWHRSERLQPPAALLKSAGLKPGSHIIEIGAGEFPWLAAIGQLGPDLTVHAVSGTVPTSTTAWQQQIQDHVRHLQGHTSYHAVAADARTLPMADRSAQMVILHEVLDRFLSRESRRQAIFDAARVLAPGGRLLVGEPQFVSEAAAALAEAGLSVTSDAGWITATKPFQ